MRVLVVDDDTISQLIFHSLFDKIQGCSVVTYLTGSSAYSAIRESNYDIIIIDNYFKNSELSGADFWMKMYHAISEDSYIIGCSTDVESKTEFYEKGADFFIIKPIHIKELQTIVDIVRTKKLCL